MIFWINYCKTSYIVDLPIVKHDTCNILTYLYNVEMGKSDAFNLLIRVCILAVHFYADIRKKCNTGFSPLQEHRLECMNEKKKLCSINVPRVIVLFMKQWKSHYFNSIIIDEEWTEKENMKCGNDNTYKHIHNLIPYSFQIQHGLIIRQLEEKCCEKWSAGRKYLYLHIDFV